MKPDWVGLDQDQWELDHETWSVLAHLCPNANIPVVQLSVNALKPFEYRFRSPALIAPRQGRSCAFERKRRPQSSSD